MRAEMPKQVARKMLLAALAGERAVALNQRFRRCVQSITCHWSRNSLSLMANLPADENTGEMSRMVEVPQWFASGWRVNISAAVSMPIYTGMLIAAATRATERLDACGVPGIA